MHNKHRGEIAATLDGKPVRLCLTLGALADLESAFGHEDMLAIASRFSSGRLAARDAARIIGCGLRGAGHDVTDDAVLTMQADDGVAGYIDIVARLLAATFGQGSTDPTSVVTADRAAQSIEVRPEVPTIAAFADLSGTVASEHAAREPVMARAEVDHAPAITPFGPTGPFHGPR